MKYTLDSLVTVIIAMIEARQGFSIHLDVCMDNGIPIRSTVKAHRHLLYYTISEPVKAGYMASVKGYEWKVRADEVKSVLHAFVHDFIWLFSSRITDEGHYMGGWYNEDDGMYYLDVSKQFDRLIDANTFGIKNDQKAVYDLQNDVSIPVLRDTRQ